jgi:maltooligosyltrehalose trehalohydrolase
VDTAHGHGLAVIVDVVYNHVCGEPNHLQAVSPDYFRKENGNPWGSSLNFDLPAVRAFFLGNAEYWFDEFQVDGLRLDATHAIVDNSEPHILGEIAAAAHLRGGFVIAEDDRNEVRLLRPKSEGGMGVDAVWADDFHHVLKMSLKPEAIGHFKSYQGSTQEMVETLDHGWLFRGQVFPQWKKPRGTDARERPAWQFIYCISNHDQTGNRPVGERPNHLVSPEAYRAASMFFLLQPYTPMLFMGQEWAAQTPFVFFSDHGGSFGAAVSKGRLNEFKQFGSEWPATMLTAMPDPESPDAFVRSKLDWQECATPANQTMLELYRECLRYRQEDPVLRGRERNNWKVWSDGGAIFIEYGLAVGERRLLIANFETGASKEIALPPPSRAKSGWEKVFSSNEKRFGGDGLKPLVTNGEIQLSGASAVLLAVGA